MYLNLHGKFYHHCNDCDGICFRAKEDLKKETDPFKKKVTEEVF